MRGPGRCGQFGRCGQLVRRDLDARAVATFLQAYSLGLIVHDVDPKEPDEGKLTHVIMTALRAILGPAD